MSWKKLLESTKESLNDHMRLRNAYLMAKNRILHNQIDGRVQFTDSERKELAEIGAKLGKKVLAEVATVARPETILAWNRKLANQSTDISKRPKPVGRPRVDKEIEDWMLYMAQENRSWGYDRIQRALKHLGYTISDQTVGNILKRHDIPPAPERQQTITWHECIRSHGDVLRATSFFNSEIWCGFAPIICSLLSVIHFSRDQAHSVSGIPHRWMQVLKVLIPRALSLGLDLCRCAHPVTKRSQARQVNQMVMEPIRSAFESAD